MTFLKLYSTFVLQLHQSLFSSYTLIINVYLYHIFNRFFFIEDSIYILYIYISFSIFFSLNFCFLVNSELITSFITLLSKNASTIILSYVLILSSFIFIVTFLNMSLLFRLQPDIFFTIFLSIANLLILKPN